MKNYLSILLIIYITQFKISYSQSLRMTNNYFSLRPKDSLQICLTVNKKVKWSTNNEYFRITQSGKVFIDTLPPWNKKVGKVYCQTYDNLEIDSCEVTAVDWNVGKSKLSVTAILPKYHILEKEGSTIYFALGRKLYKTNDGFLSAIYISRLPWYPTLSKFLITPYGYFLRCDKIVYFSKNLKNWKVSFIGRYGGIYHQLASYFDSTNLKVYIYMGEYTWENPNNEHRVYRGIVSPDGITKWDTIMKFRSRNSYNVTPAIRPIARHIHVVQVDPFTGNVWVGTGDEEYECSISYSNDHGNTFHLLGMGIQDFRTLSFWFTEKYIYWNMDSTDPQSIWRISRKIMNQNEFYPSMSPELDSGYTKKGIKYYVTKNDSNYFPVSEGKTYIENEGRELNKNNKVIPFGDPSFDYKEKIATLACGSMWYTLCSINKKGEYFTLMSTAPEGNHYDNRTRTFGIKEYHNGKVDVQELITLPPVSPGVLFSQLEPKVVDNNSNIYFESRTLKYEGLYKASLIWNDSISNFVLNCCDTSLFKIEKNNTTNYSIFPNPSNGEFTVYSKNGFLPYTNYSFELYNITGEIVYNCYDVSIVSEMEKKLSFDKAIKGIYFLRVRYNNQVDIIGKVQIY